jgi:putative thioredoxin
LKRRNSIWPAVVGAYVDTTNVIEVGESTFERDVLARSHEVPVVVDFWAAWCGPCRVLGPTLERLAGEAAGDWVLAKVDVDANPQLAAAFGIQGIPAVRAFKDGRQVAEFVGALPEEHVARWLAELGPSPAEVAVAEGQEAEARGDVTAARDSYRRALQEEPGHATARSALERIELVLRSSSLDEDDLRRRVDADPADLSALRDLADLEAVRGRVTEAFELLLSAVRRFTGDDREAARRHLVKLLETVPPDDPRAMAARRSLSLALF